MREHGVVGGLGGRPPRPTRRSIFSGLNELTPISAHGLRVRGTWLGNHISQHADLNFRCQEQLWNNITLSASARSLKTTLFDQCARYRFPTLCLTSSPRLSFHIRSQKGWQDEAADEFPATLARRGKRLRVTVSWDRFDFTTVRETFSSVPFGATREE